MAPLTYRFRLSDDEFRRAWLAEYYRRPGLRIVRVATGPGLVFVGVALLRGPERFGQIMGGVCVAFGIYYAFKPFLAAYLLGRQRKASGAAAREVSVTLDDEGISIDDGRAHARLAWSEVTAAGRGAGYIWYELRGGPRATLPLRAVKDPEALAACLSAHTAWSG